MINIKIRQTDEHIHHHICQSDNHINLFIQFSPKLNRAMSKTGVRMKTFKKEY